MSAHLLPGCIAAQQIEAMTSNYAAVREIAVTAPAAMQISEAWVSGRAYLNMDVQD